MLNALAVFAASLALTAASPAETERSFPSGLRLEVDLSHVTRGTLLSSVSSNGQTVFVPALSTHLLVGYEFGNFVPMLGVGFNKNSAEATLEDFDGETYEGKNSLLMLELQLEGRYYFSKDSIRPYVFGNLFSSFPFYSQEVDGKEAPEEAIEQIEDRMDYWGFGAGLGLDYAVSDHFIVGGAWGVGGAFQSEDSDARESSSSSLNSQVRLRLAWVF